MRGAAPCSFIRLHVDSDICIGLCIAEMGRRFQSTSYRVLSVGVSFLRRHLGVGGAPALAELRCGCVVPRLSLFIRLVGSVIDSALMEPLLDCVDFVSFRVCRLTVPTERGPGDSLYYSTVAANSASCWSPPLARPGRIQRVGSREDVMLIPTQYSV